MKSLALPLGIFILLSLAVPAMPASASVGAIDSDALAAPAIRTARRVGVMVVGAAGDLGQPAADLVQGWLEGARHHVMRLPSLKEEPRRAVLASISATDDLDAMALVQILTRTEQRTADGQSLTTSARARVQFRDRQGEAVEWGIGQLLPDVDFAFTPRPADAPIETGEESQAGDPVVPLPRMFLSAEKGRSYLGDARLKDAELYQLVGRADLERRYWRRRYLKRALSLVGWGSVAAGSVYATVLVIADVGRGLASEGEPNNGPSPSFLVPQILVGAGALVAVCGMLLPADPTDQIERLQLMHEYNAHITNETAPPDAPRPAHRPSVSLSLAPLVAGSGHASILGGQLGLSF